MHAFASDQIVIGAAIRPCGERDVLRQASPSLLIFKAHRTRHEVFAMQKLICSSLIIITVTCASSNVAADEGGWKMPNLNPFSGGSHPPASGGTGQPPTSGWKMPKLWSQPPAQPKKRINQSATKNRGASGTQSFLSKTADALNPWDKKQPAPPPKLTGSNSVFTSKSTTTPAKKDDSVKPASWWSSDKKSEPPRTVNEFLSKPRP
jgi:hypothetical protein